MEKQLFQISPYFLKKKVVCVKNFPHLYSYAIILNFFGYIPSLLKMHHLHYKYRSVINLFFRIMHNSKFYPALNSNEVLSTSRF